MTDQPIPLFKGDAAKPSRSEIMKQWWRDRRTCRECLQNPVEPPDRICEGCDAYRDHTGHY